MILMSNDGKILRSPGASCSSLRMTGAKMRRDPLIIEEIATPFSSIGLFRQFRDERYLFLLDSGMDRQKLGRFSFLGFAPFLTFSFKNGSAVLTEEGSSKTIECQNPFSFLRELLDRYRIDNSDSFLPFTGGAVGYFSYDLCRYLEDVPSNALDDIDIPDCSVSFYDRVIVFDHLKDRTFICSSGFPFTGGRARLARARERFRDLKERVSRAKVSAGPFSRERGALSRAPLESNFSKAGYISAINEAKEYIKKGDIYQVNLSQRFSCELEMPAQDLFERSRSINPAPFAAYLDLGEVKIVSASPERFLCKKGRNIHTRPIKGTRPRGKDPADDERLKIELLASKKDRAEHIMIVDLERNDLGRICEYGTVHPTEFVVIEAYSTVFHLVSTVSGRLAEGIDAVDCFTHAFPGGSITGAPKIRSMSIIDSLEPTKRSVYTGSIGYIGFNGNMDTSIVIRTFIIKDGRAYFQAGGGIVADSDPEMEYQETLDKAKALIEALGKKAQPVIARSDIARI